MIKKITRILALLSAIALLGTTTACSAQAAAANNTASSAPSSTESTENSNSETEKPKEKERFVMIEITMKDGGVMKLELDREAAPLTVENFEALVEEGFYDGLIFHRIIPGFMIQGGDPDGTGMGGPGHNVKGEFAANGWENPIKHARGAISMARSQNPDSAGSQFFIVHEDSFFLDGNYATFGNLVEGFDVLDEIANVATGAQDRPKDDVVIETIRIVE